MTATRAELRRTVSKLSTVDERRAALIAQRDRQIVDLLAQSPPPSWAELQEITGLSLRGLQQAILRGRESQA